MEGIKFTNLERVLNDFADEVIAKARENLDANGSNATHQLSDNMEKEVKIEDDRMQVFIALEDYWKYLEFGTGPAHMAEVIGVDPQAEPRAQYWPRIGPLKEWVANKPGVPKEDSFAYAVRGKIHKEGAKPHPFLNPAIEYVLPRYEQLFTEAIEQDVQDYLTNSLNL